MPDTTATSAEDTVDEVTQRKQFAGGLLKKYREAFKPAAGDRRGLNTRPGLAAALAVNESVLGSWERGTTEIHADKLHLICDLLQVNDAQRIGLINAVLPATNPSYLKQKPAYLRGALLLKAQRELTGKTQWTFGKELDYTNVSVSGWEIANQPIPQSLLKGGDAGKMRRALKLDGPKNERAWEYFVQQVTEANAAIYLKDGKAAPQAVSALPPLVVTSAPLRKTIDDPIALHEQGEKLLESQTALECRAGDVLRELIGTNAEKQGYKTRKDFADALGVSEATVTNWINKQEGVLIRTPGNTIQIRTRIPGKMVGKICSTLKLDEVAHKNLMLARFPAFDEKWLAQVPEHLRAALLFDEYCQLIEAKNLELTSSLDVNDSAVSGWANARVAIPKNKVEEIIEKLEIGKSRLFHGDICDRADQFRQAVEASREPIKKINSALRAGKLALVELKQTALGATSNSRALALRTEPEADLLAKQ